MSDLISRQAAIDAIQKAYVDTEEGEDKCAVWKNIGLTNALHIMQDLPSAQPKSLCNTCRYTNLEWYEEPCDSCTMGGESNHYKPSAQRTGEWEITDAYPHNVYCSECHKKFAQTHWAVWENGSLPRNYCPNCGADMRGDNNV